MGFTPHVPKLNVDVGLEIQKRGYQEFATARSTPEDHQEGGPDRSIERHSQVKYRGDGKEVVDQEWLALSFPRWCTSGSATDEESSLVSCKGPFQAMDDVPSVDSRDHVGDCGSGVGADQRRDERFQYKLINGATAFFGEASDVTEDMEDEKSGAICFRSRSRVS